MYINWNEFMKILRGEFIKNNSNVTEGMIRYWFAEGVRCVVENLSIEESYFGNKIILNKSKPQLCPPNKNELHADLYFEKANKSYVFEFKYDRGTDYTEMVGKAFNDLNRLSVIDNDEKYFVYVFTERVKIYYQNKFNGMFDINDSQTTHSVNGNFHWWNKSFPKSFLNKAFKSFVGKHTDFSAFDYTVEVCYSKEIATYTTNKGEMDKIYMLILRVNK